MTNSMPFYHLNYIYFCKNNKGVLSFLEAGFMPKNSELANEAEHYKREFEKLLSYTVSVSYGRIRPNVLQSGEIVTNYALGTE